MYAKVQKAQRGAINVPQIWNDDRLSLLEKSLMWVLISKENEFCRLGVKFNITREVLAKCLSTCEKSVSRAIKTLQELDYIKVEIIKRKNYYTINWDMMNKVQEELDRDKENEKNPEQVSIPIPETLKEPKEEPAEEPIEEMREDTETKPEPEPDTEPKEEEPQIIEKDWYRMNARLDGAERMSQDLNAFLVSNQSDLEESGFTREEIVEEYYKRFDMTA